MKIVQDAVTARARVMGIVLLLAAALGGCGSEIDRPSLLLITLDTTRADRLGAYGYPEAGTHQLDALAQQGTLFEWAFTPVPITLPSHTTMLTGTYPSRHGVRDNGHKVGPDLVTLAELMQSADFRTAAFVAAFPLYARFGLDRGFELYDDEVSLPTEEGRLFRQRVAKDMVGLSTGWLSELGQQERFFLWVHFFDPHHSYLPPPPYAQWYRSDPYQGEIAYMDEWVGKLVAHLDELGRADNTLVVVVADHGEGLGDHGEVSHSTLLYNSTLRVPFILRGKGIRAGQRVEAPVSTVDLLPTILELLSLQPPSQLQGVSLVPLLNGTAQANQADQTDRVLWLESFYARFHHGWSELEGVVAEGWKYIEAPSAGGNPELYELATDPDETRDRIAEEPALASRLREKLEHRRQREPDAPSQARQPELSADERRELEALGYLTEQPEWRPGKSIRDPRDMVEVTAAYVAAMSLFNRGQFAVAEPLVAKVERLDPGSFSAHDIRGRYLLEQTDDDLSQAPRALEELQKALALSRENPAVWRNVGEAHLALGDWPPALRHFAKAISLAPPMPDLERDYAEMLANAALRASELSQSDDQVGALALWDVLVEVNPDDEESARRAKALRRRIQSD